MNQYLSRVDERRTPYIEHELLREATAYAHEHGAPLLRRLCSPLAGEYVIVAGRYDDDRYILTTGDAEAHIAPRRVSFEYLRGSLEWPDIEEMYAEVRAAIGDENTAAGSLAGPQPMSSSSGAGSLSRATVRQLRTSRRSSSGSTSGSP